MNRMLLAFPLLALPALAHAQPVTGLYVGAGAGADFRTNEFLKFDSLQSKSLDAKGRGKFDTGVMGQASVGYGFGNGFRVEVEGVYTSNQLRGSRPAVYQESYGALVNGLFDFDIGSPYLFPYAGVGGGYLHSNRGYTNSRDTAAYQGILGVSIPIPFVVGLSATIDYRFLGLADSKRRETFSGSQYEVKSLNNLSNTAMVGLRYQFDTAPPPPPPAAAAIPVTSTAARTYLVFFDWDRADLTARARQIIADAASNAAKVQYTRIEVAGNADRSGTPAYNLALSRRRADNVAGELVRLGVPRAAIAVEGFGDTRPLVPTAAGVREPQNRRVEIVIR